MGKNDRDFKTIIFTTDFTATSVHAASYAVSLARSYGARLQVLHVVDTSEEAAGFYFPHISYENLDEELKEAAEARLKKFCAKSLKGVKDIEQTVLVGEPYKQILKASAGADLIVMGAVGKAHLDRMIFGSTTERVMRKSKCPVMVIPPTG
ncbi:MAG: universal stress protein [Thermodesulfobacteriota bacterium]